MTIKKWFRKAWKKRIIRKQSNGWRLQIGGCNGEAFNVQVIYFKGKGIVFSIDLNTERLVERFGFNHRHKTIKWAE